MQSCISFAYPGIGKIDLRDLGSERFGTSLMTNQREQYTMGYGQAATSIMAARTAQTHAAFFLPYLKPGMRVLDCGCGPGTITVGFGEVVAPGEVVGTELEERRA